MSNNSNSSAFPPAQVPQGPTVAPPESCTHRRVSGSEQTQPAPEGAVCVASAGTAAPSSSHTAGHDAGPMRKSRERKAEVTAALSPRRVTRGERSPEGQPSPDGGESLSAAFLDWLAFTVRPPVTAPDDPGLWVKQHLETMFCLPSMPFEAAQSGRKFGYEHRVNLGEFGILLFGGASQRGTFHVELNSQGSALVQDWAAVCSWGEECGAWITRVDLAHDDFTGERISVDLARAWYESGQFNTGGPAPAHDINGDWFTPGSPKGRTFYIGSREAGKLTRMYEKGKQLGAPESPWCRAETEFHNKGRVLPWDMVTKPGAYLAGAYPCFAFLSAEQERIKTLQKSASISYDAMARWVRTAAGKSLHVMVQVNDGDAGAVLAEVIREGVPKRLKSYDAGQLPVLVGAA